MVLKQHDKFANCAVVLTSLIWNMYLSKSW